MKRLFIILILLCFLPVRVSAMEYEPPALEGMGEQYMPEETENFWQGLWKVITSAVSHLQPSIAAAGKVCAAVIVCVLILSICRSICGAHETVLRLVGAAAIATLLFGASNSMVNMAVTTVKELSSYGQLLLPVMTGAYAAQGGIVTSGALYAGTAAFDAILSGAISRLMTPLVYIYLVLSVGSCALGESALGKLRDQMKWLVTWALKTALYIFMGYMGITKVISGSTDAAALKATKLTISGLVPVVGGILSEASETVLISAGIMKNSVGIYGLLAIAAIWIEPFLLIGAQYLFLKWTAAICDLFGTKDAVALIRSFSSAMGLLLGMTGSVCLMLMVSVICFLKGVT